MSKSNGDDNNFIENGDLGLGLGLKPGGIRFDTLNDNSLEPQCTESTETKLTSRYIPIIQNKYHSLPFLKPKFPERKCIKNESSTNANQCSSSVGKLGDDHNVNNSSGTCSNSVMSKSPGILFHLSV